MAYKAGSSSARDGLVGHYRLFVEQVAGRVAATLPSMFELDDLVSYGNFGLLEALGRFDPAQGVPFERYAARRINGAIIDGLRSVDWVPRAVRDHARAVQRAYVALGSRGVPLTDANVAAEIGVTPAELRVMLGEFTTAIFSELDRPLFAGAGRGSEGGGDTDWWTIGDHLPDAEGPEAILDRDMMKRLLAEALSAVADREKAVLMLLYIEGLSADQIGEVLGVKGDRISQLHTRAVLALRARMTESAPA